MILATLLLVLAQDTAQEAELTTAIRTTISKGFAYSLRPVANIPDGFPKDRLALAGAPIQGEYADGVAHAKDGSYEIYRKDGRTVVRTERGWLPLAMYTSPLRQDVAQAFDDRDGRLWKRGNVTAGRKALAQLIQISHLEHRTHLDLLTGVGEAFVGLKTVDGPKIDGKPATTFEGELSEAAAFRILRGPFAALVERGTLSFRNLSGVGRVALQGGVVRRVTFKASGAYGYYEESENVRKRGLCSLEIVADLTRHGEVRVEPPKEAGLHLAE